jgi:adenylyltransferase/sulfurtransferase
MMFEYVRLKKNPKCKVCGPQPEVTALIDYDAFCGVPGVVHGEAPLASDLVVSAPELAGRLAGEDRPLLIDVREPHELAISSLPGAVNIPLGTLASRLSELDSARELVLFCKTGNRSARGLELLISAGFRKARHLQGGINAWARQVDPQLPVY